MNLRKRVPRQYVPSPVKKTCAKKKVAQKKTQKNSEKAYEVEEILDKKVVNRRIRYFLKWKGFPKSHNSWVDKSDLNCPALIRKFESNLKKEKEDSNQKSQKKNIIEKKNETDVPAKTNLKESKITRSAYNSRKNSLKDFIVESDTETKHAAKNVASNKYKISIRLREGSSGKHTGIKDVILNEHEVVKKRHYNDSQEKLTRSKNAELKKHEVIKKKHYNDYGTKHTVKNVESNEHEIIKRRHNDYGTKHTVKNVESTEREIIKRRHDNYGTKHTVKNVESNEHEIIKRRHDGLSQKKSEIAVSSSRNRKIPKIQTLQFYVKSKKFPKKRKNALPSVMTVSFQGTDVLRGLECFVEAGIAAGPLPDYLYDKPIKTGATEFHLAV